MRTLIYIDDEHKPRRIPCKNHIVKVVMWLRQIGVVKGKFSQYSLHYEDKIFNNGRETHEWAKHFMDKYDFEDCFCGYSLSQKILTKYACEIEQARIRKMEISGWGEIKKFLT